MAKVLQSEPNGFDAIMLDVDNGPEGLTQKANSWLYSAAGLNACAKALRPKGVLAVWSASADKLSEVMATTQEPHLLRPAQPPPDPWLNRAMRKEAGLLLPERRIGLSAHDYQQAVAAKRVILSRSKRGAEAETVPSRWLNRLTNLLGGLPAKGGPAALAQMRARGQHWLALADALERPEASTASAPE